jgi:hypothetical protein
VKPLVRLITSTVAPGTWRVFDENGLDVTKQTLEANSGADGSMRPRRVGSITPFYTSMSLIIRGTAETHENVGNLLRGLRSFVGARERNTNAKGSMETRARAEARLREAEPSHSPAQPKARLEQLVDELRVEVAKLPK